MESHKNLPLKGSTSLAQAKSSMSTRPKSNMNNAQSSSVVRPTVCKLNISSSEENQYNNLSVEEIIDVYHEDQRGKQLLMKKIVHPHITKLHNETTEIDEDILLGRVEQKSLTNNISTEKDVPPPPPKIPRPAKWIIIDTIGDAFKKAAAEVYAYMLSHRGAVPSFVSSLPSLLIHYLGLSPHHLFFSRVREECAEDDESVWLERPLSSHLCESLARSVMYLRELRLELLDLILVDLAQVTQLYLGALRDKDSTTVKNVMKVWAE
ncbi:hypothetical protein OTU49_011094 [Cherax quadricarinatus]|uniref:Uncharacterized protein n=1 Tax=Cherax quadricarinatus TaxID=27406 RepID=A0AAW0W4J3_CHEQU